MLPTIRRYLRTRMLKRWASRLRSSPRGLPCSLPPSGALSRRIATRPRVSLRLPATVRTHPRIWSTVAVLALIGASVGGWFAANGDGEPPLGLDTAVLEAEDTGDERERGERDRDDVRDRAPDQARGRARDQAAPPFVTPDIEVAPAGAEVARLSPITITFKEPPPQRDASKLFTVEPPLEGSFAWLTDRQALLQPIFPGLTRGLRYVVRVPATASGLDRDVEHAFTVEGRLIVQTVIPADGDVNVPAETQILVQFSRSVAPLAFLSARGDDPVIEFEPPLPGRGEWLNTSLYRFLPDAVEPSTTYTARIRRGLSSAADGVLEEDFVWTFSTNQPAVIASDPAHNTIFVPPDQAIVVTFDQPMVRASTQADVLLRNLTSGGPPLQVAASWNDASTELTLAPVALLDLSRRYEVLVPAGLPGALGGETQLDRVIQFSTIDLPRIVSTTPADGETNAGRFAISIQYNNLMNEASFDGRIEIVTVTADGAETAVPFDDERQRFIYGDSRIVQVSISVEPSTRHVVRIASGVTDRIGQRLGAHAFSFTTGAIEPSVNFVTPSRISTYSASTEPILFFETINHDAVNFSLYQISDQEAESIIQGGNIPFVRNRVWRPSQAPVRT